MSPSEAILILVEFDAGVLVYQSNTIIIIALSFLLYLLNIHEQAYDSRNNFYHHLQNLFCDTIIFILQVLMRHILLIQVPRLLAVFSITIGISSEYVF